MAEVLGADGTESPEDDWATKATSTVVGYVDTVRSASTGKALSFSRVAVYGIAAALVGFMMLILLMILLVRALGNFLSWIINLAGGNLETGTVWPAYLVLGATFLAAGMILWRKKEQ